MKYFILFMLTFTLVTACKNQEETPNKKKYGVLSSEEMEIKAQADAYINDILEAYNKNNYDLFSKNLDDIVKSKLNTEAFKEKRDEYFSKLGPFKSKSFLQMFNEEKYKMLLYSGQFEKATIRMTLVLQKAKEGYKVTGIWFFSSEINLSQPF